MLGFKVYFDGEKFVCDSFKTEVEDVHTDSTTSWFSTRVDAEKAMEELNKISSKNVKICKQCGKYFWQTDDEREWFINKNLKIPCRCYMCRKTR